MTLSLTFQKQKSSREYYEQSFVNVDNQMKQKNPQKDKYNSYLQNAAIFICTIHSTYVQRLTEHLRKGINIVECW